MFRHKKLLWSFAILFIFTTFPAFASVLSYEIYTVAQGDTPENLALRQGIEPDQIVSIDDTPWQPGKRVALLKRYAKDPSAVPDVNSSLNDANNMRIAEIIQPDSNIYTQPDDGAFLFQPEVGSKVIITTETETHYGIMMADRTTGWVEKNAAKIEGPVDYALIQNLTAGHPEVINEAFRYLGLPYRYGGSLPYNTDCSLLVQRVFRSNGVSLPRTAAEQSRVGMSVPYNAMQPGDRLYFINSRGVIGHTGIYIGGNEFIHASSARGCVAVDKLQGSYLRDLVGIRR